MTETNYQLSRSGIIENSIAFHLFQYGELTAKQIQERLGLKRQTTYNYLKKLENKKSVNIRYTPHPEKSNVKIAYYSYAKSNRPIEYHAQLKYFYEGKSDQEIRNLINDQIDLTIASLIESKIYINNQSKENLKKMIEESHLGPGIDNLSLSDEEFKELGEEMGKVMTRLWKKWQLQDEKPSNNHFIIGGFKSFY
ncbi:MAG: hypothetical protein HeimC3_09930 [Candidatus Heimdallarchaeota archaeon LC_3]|nr:MAG: hypothetical protein HeimC3_09930 [Candidatus Heimdallarchaeota archaeon LC_3]